MQLFDGLHHALGHDVGPRDGAEGDHQNHLAGRFKAELHGPHGPCVVGPAEVHISGHAAARVVDKVENRGCQAGTSAHQRNVAFEAQIGDTFLGRLELHVRVEIIAAQGITRLPGQGIIVDDQFAVPGHGLSVLGDEERIDFGQLGVTGAKNLVQTARRRADLFGFLA